MRFKLPFFLSNLKADDDLVRFTSQVVEQIQLMFSGNVGFTDNCKTSLTSVVFSKANAQQAVSHTLNEIPKGYIQCGSTVAGVVFDGNSGKNANYIYLQVSVAGTYNIMIF